MTSPYGKISQDPFADYRDSLDKQMSNTSKAGKSQKANIGGLKAMLRKLLKHKGKYTCKN